jgi:Cu(I)/Ag(I) efflux system membrane fusion protein
MSQSQTNTTSQGLVGRHPFVTVIVAIIVGLGAGLVLHPVMAPSVAESESMAAASVEPTEWTCGMHPFYRSNEPGKCPICHMDLVPVKKSGPGSAGSETPATKPGEQMGTPSNVPGHATVMIPGVLQQRIGVRIGQVEKGPLRMSVEAVGIVQPDEERIARVNIKTEGWVDKVFVNFVGKRVRKGDPLLSIYSPEFLSTQDELLIALRTERALPGVGGEQTLAESARRRLELWDVPPDEIDELQRTGQARKNLILKSPIDGTVLERKVFETQYVTPDKELYVIGDLSTVWVQAKVYEYEIPHVELGQPATVTISALPDKQFVGKVVFIQPTVEEMARTVQVRIELPNHDGIFKPGMFTQVSIRHPMGDGLLVPTSAVLRLGDRDIAYRVEPGDHFVPVEVKISPIQFGDRYQVLEGLSEGERIVSSANFLVDSESRIQVGGGSMAGMEHGNHGREQPPAQDDTGHGGQEAPVPDHSGREAAEMPGMDHSKIEHEDRPQSLE